MSKKHLNTKIITVGTHHPCVEVSYVDTKGQERKALMVVDTCCEDNHLFARANSDISIYEPHGLKQISCIVTGDTYIDEHCVSAMFMIDGIQFDEDFAMDENTIFPSCTALPIIGILGAKFMRKNKLAFDYRKMRLYRAKHKKIIFNNPNIQYITPIDFGFKLRGVPLVIIFKNDNPYFAMADSGSDTCIISQNWAGLADKIISQDSSINTIKNDESSYLYVEGPDALISFELPSFKDWENGSGDMFNCKAKAILVNSNNILTTSFTTQKANKSTLHNIDVVLGSPFMEQMKWIIDFRHKVIYTMKEPKAN